LKSPNEEHYTGSEFETWLKTFSAYAPNGNSPKTEKPASLLYEEIGALWEPIDKDDDWSAFNAKVGSFS